MTYVSLHIGVGIFANNNPVSNNSVLLADRNNQIGTVYCSSGSQQNTIGQWLAPNGAVIPQSGGSLSVVRGGGNFPAYIGLQLQANQWEHTHVLFLMKTAFKELCMLDYTIMDSMVIILLSLSVHELYFLCLAVPTVDVTSTTNPLVVFECSSCSHQLETFWCIKVV